MYDSTYVILNFSSAQSCLHTRRWQYFICMLIHCLQLRAFTSPPTLPSLPVSLMALVIYDYALTLNREIDYIWLSKWSMIKVTFLVQRYLPFLDLILLGILCAFYDTAFWVFSHSDKDFEPHNSAQPCGHLFALSICRHTVTLATFLRYASHFFISCGRPWSMRLSLSVFRLNFYLCWYLTEMATVLLTLRVWAVYGQDRRMGIALFLAFISCWTAAFAFIGICIQLALRNRNQYSPSFSIHTKALYSCFISL
jgi:hypothetical protein